MREHVGRCTRWKRRSDGERTAWERFELIELRRNVGLDMLSTALVARAMGWWISGMVLGRGRGRGQRGRTG